MQADNPGQGRLVLAATPMGDIGDASKRLCDALGSADVVAAEDTRRTRALAAALGVTVTGRVVSFYDQVEAARTPALVADVEAGKTVLLVTDAGMPSVSDPGYRLVSACVAAGLPVTCLPGPSAVTTALALSALPVERFCFEGFPPRKAGARRAWLQTLAAEPRAVVFFEAPHRLAACLADAVDVLGGQRRAAVCRELTKTYEEVRRGTLAELAQWAADGARGEITVVLEGASAQIAEPAELVDEVERLVSDGVRLKDACAQVATSGVSKRELYDAVLAARQDEPSS
ncbi:16S rRNA (cytidine(1402)-2'-O)-methyltransferase [Rhodococcus sp. WB1]|jgi:16S rRNA (cytidine1402-2'-O)-methyltransferase|uniref:16S rRNA (cytidine(1402)-2'-O)-methyltransferase n=1 Tax=Rhodococcus TaxID=1827 RepID=UPI000622C6A9|nr:MULTISPECIES: 16S rRNA (cytidine(1402)-2'-O)-methyltransferase [Rhodococcus]AKE89042.1 16S rRNA methyltransferase [Rhodococcus aetherivorans]ANZ26264.1 16S rRNA (cytidine(1402)-2'-O)-methyltransferase [Rhodococcus sp. WB1]MBC2591247.1 16S rRNA (cytidine(1402)-2'-O)-methyltransferase [Rhodococcus aetherivorans]QIX49467.1 16S rRNA (cytidine(1402)-2'-O)-methyltransferase [Rhodococcus sp. DMU1]WFS13126.1 16S rRNA (cytidine(1402)-2'-O)-methyltransferase [Rhodococcus aetherivorans]